MGAIRYYESVGAIEVIPLSRRATGLAGEAPVRLTLPSGVQVSVACVIMMGLEDEAVSSTLSGLHESLLADGMAVAVAEQGYRMAKIEHVETAVRWIEQQPEVNKACVGIAAGGPTAAIVLEATRHGLIKPAVLVLWSPFLGYTDFVRMTAPTLIVTGSEDPDIDLVRDAVGRGECAYLCLIRGASGVNDERAVVEASAITTEWFKGHLQDPTDIAELWRDTGVLD